MAIKKTIKNKAGDQNLNKIDKIDATPAAPVDMTYQAAHNALAQAAIDALQQYGGEADGAARKQYAVVAADKKVGCVESKEKEKIWRGAVKKYKNEQARLQLGQLKCTLAPDDYTDIGEAKAFVREYGRYVLYCKSTDWLWYDDTRWEGDNYEKVHGLVQDFTQRQLEESDQMYQVEANKEKPNKKLLAMLKSYKNFAYKERSSRRQKDCMNEAKPQINIKIKAFDNDPYILNTPDGEIDLRTGQMNPHRPEHHLMKITSVGPSRDNQDIWYDFLDRLTGGDHQLQQYLQLVTGMAAVGKVYYEGLVVAVGEGGNGKSTFFNSVKAVLGDYTRMINSNIFVRHSNINKESELAMLKGTRLAITAELDAGTQLDTGMLKRTSSTDLINARMLYHNSMEFPPTHTMVMYTNHLPQVDVNDSGTWERLIIVPFFTKFRNTSGEVKDYCSYLVDHCGGAILQWIIDGAVNFFKADCKIQRPVCVQRAVDDYREENDWLGHFIEDRCVVDPSNFQQSSSMYCTYKAYCAETGETRRSMSVFKKAMEKAGFPCDHKSNGNFYIGISCRLG